VGLTAANRDNLVGAEGRRSQLGDFGEDEAIAARLLFGFKSGETETPIVVPAARPDLHQTAREVRVINSMGKKKS